MTHKRDCPLCGERREHKGPCERCGYAVQRTTAPLARGAASGAAAGPYRQTSAGSALAPAGEQVLTVSWKMRSTKLWYVLAALAMLLPLTVAAPVLVACIAVPVFFAVLGTIFQYRGSARGSGLRFGRGTLSVSPRGITRSWGGKRVRLRWRLRTASIDDIFTVEQVADLDGRRTADIYARTHLGFAHRLVLRSMTAQGAERLRRDIVKHLDSARVAELSGVVIAPTRPAVRIAVDPAPPLPSAVAAGADSAEDTSPQPLEEPAGQERNALRVLLP